MVEAIRAGRSVREVAASFGVSVSTVAYWVVLAQGKRTGRMNFGNRKPGRPWNRTTAEVEQRILSARSRLREESVLGEYGPDAIGLALRQDEDLAQLPGRTTIYRVLARHGLLDGAHRQRRPAPPKGWYLPDLAAGRAELDSFDFIEDLKIADGPLVSVLTGTSLHGALADAWIMEQPRATTTVDALIERWGRDGLPDYAQFDNDTVFQGAHQFAHSVGRREPAVPGPGHRPSVRAPARAGLPERDRRLQRPVAEQGVAATALPRPGHAQGRLGTLHRCLSRQDGPPSRGRPRPASLPPRLPARSERAPQGHDHLPAPKRRGRCGRSARNPLPHR